MLSLLGLRVVAQKRCTHVPSLYVFRVLAKVRHCFSPGRNLVNCWYVTGTTLDMDQDIGLDKIYT